MTDMRGGQRIVAAIDQRIEKKTKIGATIETTWGTVAGITADGKYASAYLYGSDYASEGFRIPGTLALNVGDKVKVAWDARGERWVYDIGIPSDYKKVSINPNTGEILTGDGTVPPSTPVSVEGHAHGITVDALDFTATTDMYPDGVSTFSGSLAQGWPSDFTQVTTFKYANARIFQLVTTHSGEQAWIRIGHSSEFGTNAWGSLIPFTPDDLERIRLSATDDASLSSTLHALQIGPSSGENIIADVNEIMARNNGAASPLYLNNDGGDVRIGDGSSAVTVPGFLYAGIPTVTRLKTTSQAVGQFTAGMVAITSFTSSSISDPETFTLGTNYIEVKKDGYYVIFLAGSWDSSSTGNRGIGIAIANAATPPPGSASNENLNIVPASPAGGSIRMSAAFMARLIPNDRVSMVAYQNADASENIFSCAFSMWLISYTGG